MSTRARASDRARTSQRAPGSRHARDATSSSRERVAAQQPHASGPRGGATLRGATHFASGTYGRVITAIACGVVAYAMLSRVLYFESSVLAGWDAGALTYLALAWAVILRTDASQTRQRSEMQDVSRYVLFTMVIGAACASIVTIGFMLHGARELKYWPRALHIVLAMLALTSSWVLIHTLFSFHYAHRYYGDNDAQKGADGGLVFPNDHEPDYLDFAYYSFVIGMTSQVSDVQVTTRAMRRLTMLHGVLSFLFNLAIVAMSINIIGDTLR